MTWSVPFGRTARDTFFRKSASKMINRLIQRTTGKAMGTTAACCAYRRHIIDAMLNCHERSTFIPILANNSRARRAVEIPVMHAEREFGDSKCSFMRLINLMYDR